MPLDKDMLVQSLACFDNVKLLPPKPPKKEAGKADNTLNDFSVFSENDDGDDKDCIQFFHNYAANNTVIAYYLMLY